MFERLGKFDPTTFLNILFLCLMSLLALFSISYGVEGMTNYFFKQSIFLLLGIMVYLTFNYLPLKLSYNYIYWIYILTLVSLVIVMFFGNYVNGSRRWFLLGPLKIQPSEPAKLITIITLARYVSDTSTDLKRFKDLFIAILIIAIPFQLIRMQPDLGTSLTFVIIALPMLYWGGMPFFYVFAVITTIAVLVASFVPLIFYILLIIFIGILYVFKVSSYLKILLMAIYISAGLFAPTVWNDVLKPHQRSRILTFIGQGDVKGSGYQVTQSRIAIGSGGDFGKGIKEGTQVHLKLVPEVHTDMVIAIVGEETGFFGIMIIIGLFSFLIIRLVFYASLTKSQFSGTILVGVATLLFYHMFTNMGMAIGIMPVTGLPLPFVSYGGSALLTNMMMLGICGNIIANRFEV